MTRNSGKSAARVAKGYFSVSTKSDFDRLVSGIIKFTRLFKPEEATAREAAKRDAAKRELKRSNELNDSTASDAPMSTMAVCLRKNHFNSQKLLLVCLLAN